MPTHTFGPGCMLLSVWGLTAYVCVCVSKTELKMQDLAGLKLHAPLCSTPWTCMKTRLSCSPISARHTHTTPHTLVQLSVALPSSRTHTLRESCELPGCVCELSAEGVRVGLGMCGGGGVLETKDAATLLPSAGWWAGHTHMLVISHWAGGEHCGDGAYILFKCCYYRLIVASYVTQRWIKAKGMTVCLFLLLCGRVWHYYLRLNSKPSRARCLECFQKMHWRYETNMYAMSSR